MPPAPAPATSAADTPPLSKPRSRSHRVAPDAAATVEKSLPNGDLYRGGFSGTAPHGHGKYLWSDGCMYEGSWRRGKASGDGKFSWPSGATFQGSFRSGRMDGLGTFTGVAGDSYSGSWVNDKKHGYGTKTYSNGDSYEGNWRRNLQEGHGRYVWRNGNQYVGEWRDGVMAGRGVLIWANGNRYDGNWEHGVPKGSGVFTWPDGSCYVGAWNKDQKAPHYLNGVFYPAATAARNPKRCSVDGGALERSVSFPRICIWDSDGEAGDITCDIIDTLEVYKEPGSVSSLGCHRRARSSFCSGEVKKPGLTISKGHKNYDLMLNCSWASVTRWGRL